MTFAPGVLGGISEVGPDAPGAPSAESGKRTKTLCLDGAVTFCARPLAWLSDFGLSPRAPWRPNVDAMTINHEIAHRRRGAWRALFVALGLTSLGAAACSSGSSTGTNSPTTVSGPTSTPSTSSNPSAPSTASPSSVTTTVGLASALDTAYQAESGALATYRNVVSTLGQVGPFPNNVSAEEQHVSALTAILSRYTITAPTAGAGQASPSTLTAACQLGVTTEQNIISMYNDQLPKLAFKPSARVLQPA